MSIFPTLATDASALAALAPIGDSGFFNKGELVSYIQAPNDEAGLRDAVRPCLVGVDARTRARFVLVLPHERMEFGVYRLGSLASALSAVDDAEELPIKLHDLERRAIEPDEPLPWQVMIKCPVFDPPAEAHRVTFSGPAGQQPPIINGIPAGDREEALEDAVIEDLSPRKSLDRTQEQLKRVLEGQALVTAVIAGFGWLTGSVDRAVRESPRWFSYAIAVIVASFVLATFGYIVGAARRANVNDLIQVRKSYMARQETLVGFAWASTFLFGVGLVIAAIIPIRVADRSLQIPSPVVTFDAASLPTTATIEGSVDNLAADEVVTLVVTSYRSEADLRPPILVRQTAQPSVDGKVTFKTKLPLTRGGPWLVALIYEGMGDPPSCSPVVVSVGCTVVSLPPRERTS